ncbi:hypothetical protein IQ268_01280 [Oculatella sp. LEGE 06141]|uniref:hypothetical protein n=1 Tax=Oculatella sp. LEGE 06141 TaxID=1828648 RepID=UPI00187DFF3F|nr:hypothetical protein [Oculatella sp. LEGE 06141]MBE9177205.1 hypothetical protein [Oculatella sp. LEGE 06141]
MASRFSLQLNQAVAAVCVAIICVVAIGAMQIPRLNELRRTSAVMDTQTLNQQVEADRVQLSFLNKAPTFGFNNLLADWLFLDFLQYYGDDEARAKTGYGLSPDYFEVILGRDPYFLEAYTFLSTSSTIYAGMPERSVAIMERSLKAMKPNVPPGSYFAWRQKGIDELLFLGDAEAARRSFETAAEWASQSSLEGSDRVAEMSRQTADFLAKNPNSKSAQIGAWIMVYTTTPDELTRQVAVQRIEALGGQIVEADGGFSVQMPEQD